MFRNQCARMGDLLHLGQLFKACGNNYFAHILGILWRCQKLLFFKWNHFLATFIDIWQHFTGHTVRNIQLGICSRILVATTHSAK